MRFLFLLPLLFSLLDAKIIETAKIKDVLPHIDEKTWFLVDLDNTLFEGGQSLGHATWFYEEIETRMKSGMTKEEAFKDFYPQWIATQKICPVVPLEKEFISAIHALQEKGVVVMGLTHRQPLIMDSTLRQVRSLGLDFTKTAPSKENLILPAKTPTAYTEGILFVGDFNKKGEIFLPFLDKIQKKPEKVVFIDDKKKNVEELETTLAAQGVDYVGVFYKAIYEQPSRYSRKTAEFQMQFLSRIMSDEEAEKLMRAE